MIFSQNDSIQIPTKEKCHNKLKPYQHSTYQLDYYIRFGGARGVMVIIVGNGHDDTSSNPGRD